MTAAALGGPSRVLKRRNSGSNPSSSNNSNKDANHDRFPSEKNMPSSSQQLYSENVFQWMETCAAGFFSTCDVNTSATSAWKKDARNETLHSLDFAQLHDHFLESLLQEAASPDRSKNNYSIYNPYSPSSPGVPDDSDSSVFSSNNRKKRLPRLRKPDVKNTSTNDSEQLPVKPIDPSAPPLLPEHFLHEHVRMQKDKGRGEDPGSLICARGPDACLEKLRAKMQLLCNTAIQEKGASMKRRPARVSIYLNNFVETRSILEVRLGFLSMMYGILLRWDTNITGKITMVVLRKMCYESFYPNTKTVPIATSASGSSGEEEHEHNLSRERSSPRVIEGKAIIDWPDGTEVSILEPPYLISRPEKFKPTVLTVSSLHASGLDRKGSWLVQFVLESQVVTLCLVFDESLSRFVPRSTWEGTTYELDSFDATLEVKLYQIRQRRRKCAGTVLVPLGSLPVRKDPPTHMSIPCGADATLDMDLIVESEYLEWTRRELDARRKTSNFFWPRSTTARSKAPTPPPPMAEETDDDEDAEDTWGWILCYAC
ncbi:hypothetical protein ACA910_015828 [Epithemia clementina (nom. ined.)]